MQVEFYDRVGQHGQTVDLLDVVREPVAFTVAVMGQAFRRGGRWDLLDVVTLSDEEQRTVYRKAKIDLISGRLTVYWENPAGDTWGETPATLKERLVLEPSAVWDAEQVEDRLRDHFAHRPSRWLESPRQPFLDAAT